MRQKIKLISVLMISALMGWLAGNIAVQLRTPTSIYASGGGYFESTAFRLPFGYNKSTQGESIEVVPLGLTIGVRINTNGVMVLGTGSFLGEDGQTHSPGDGILRGGDLIIKANEKPIDTKEDLSQLVASSQGDITLLLRRDGNELEVTITPALAAKDSVRRIGTWVRDSTKGIGTLTYYMPGTGAFGALGHGIMDVDTKKLLSVRNGAIMPSTVASIVKGQRGKPGELEGSVDNTHTLGNVKLNSPSGIYGNLDPTFMETLPKETMPAATRAQIREGQATILTSVVDNKVQEFEINIESVNRMANDDTKGMIIRITDPTLLSATGGIVQGMSGSPIIQDGRIIGAITHVFVQDPTKGYGIFIETMLEQSANAKENPLL
ncbi:MAG: SpoIVB peptidase [Defluviitaleaceae bacterium]|nr:SpoIVB peptidase [Defluviitaleaceae bacterium]